MGGLGWTRRTGGCSGCSGVRNPGRGGLGQTRRTGERADAADAADYRILDGADRADYGILDGRTDWQTRRTMESWTGWTGAAGVDGADGADGADWRMRRTGADWGRRGGGGRIGSSLEGRKGWTRKPGAGVRADWEDRLRCARPGRLASLHLRAEGIPRVLSSDADCGVIWLHTPGIHITFFGAHVVVIFLGTHTSKAQRASISDKFLGSLGALNITYSMFIQMGHAIRDVVVVTYKGGLSSLVPPLPLCTSCCS